MKGSIRKPDPKRSRKTWGYRIDCGKKEDGSRNQIERAGFKTEGEAEVAMIQALGSYNASGHYKENKKLTFRELYDEFISMEAPITREYATILRYNSLNKNHLNTEFGDMWLGAITHQAIQKFILSKSQNYSDEYVRSIYNLLLVLFGYAKRKEYLLDNPMPRVTPPKKPRTSDDISIYTKDDLQKLHNRLQSTNLLTAFQLGIHLGVRAGECYGLCWSDFDFDKNTVRINKQLQYQNKLWCFTPTKTANSDRTIAFDSKLKQYLLDLRDRQQLCCTNRKVNKVMNIRDKKNPRMVTVEDFVNIKENGEMLNTYSHKVIARIADKELGIDFKFHHLRHTHATVLLEKGINPKYIQERLGHSKLEFTLRLYTHVTRKMETDSADALGVYLDF